MEIDIHGDLLKIILWWGVLAATGIGSLLIFGSLLLTVGSLVAVAILLVIFGRLSIDKT